MSNRHGFANLGLFLAAILVMVLIAWPALAAPGGAILYAAPVPSGSQDCSSWQDACTLQAALGSATQGAQIWVKKGVHKPGATADDTFALVDGVALYGGFEGMETQLSQRDWQSNPTVLSGDIGGDDLTDPFGVVTDTARIIGENSEHVITSTGVLSDTVLDGFIVTAGQADFSNRSGGAGMYNDGGSPTLVNIIFSGNLASWSGGGMDNWNGGSPSLTNVTFQANQAFWGGGMSNTFAISATLKDVTFRGNIGTAGGGMYNFQSSPALVNVAFIDNGAQGGNGAGMNNDQSSPSLINAIFLGNVAQCGGGVYNQYGSSPILINATFWDNFAEFGEGGGLCNLFGSDAVLVNTILWENQATNAGPQIYNSSSAPVISFSDIEGSGGSGGGWDPALGTDGGGNIDADPLFVNVGSGDLRLALPSPAIDAGNNLPVSVNFDLGGNPRFIDIPSMPDTGNGTPPIVDMGAFETLHLPFRIYLPVALQTYP